MNLHKPAMTISFGLFLHNVGFSVDYHFSLDNNIIGMVINNEGNCLWEISGGTRFSKKEGLAHLNFLK